MRRCDRAMALIATQIAQLRSEHVAPQHRIAAISGMTEIKRIGHLRDVAPHQLRIAAVAIAGKDQRMTANALAGAIAALDLHTVDGAIGTHQQRCGRALRDDRNVAGFGRGAQPIHQFTPGAARQPVHAHRRMAGIVEIIDDVERQIVSVAQPFDQSARMFCHRLDDNAVRLIIGFAKDVGGKQRRRCRRYPWRAGSGSRRRE